MPEFIWLRPSEICYSQCSISSKFADGSNIGELLEDILIGRCFVSGIPFITVVKYNDSWITMDNRRLWVFKQLESLDRCEQIQAKVRKKLPPNRLTTKTSGKTIRIRGKVVTRSGNVLSLSNNTEKVNESIIPGENRSDSYDPEAVSTPSETEQSKIPCNEKKRRRLRRWKSNANNSDVQYRGTLRKDDVAVMEEDADTLQSEVGERHCHCRSTMSRSLFQEPSEYHHFDDYWNSYDFDGDAITLSDESTENDGFRDDDNLVGDILNVWDEPVKVSHRYHRNESIDPWSDAKIRHTALDYDYPLLESYSFNTIKRKPESEEANAWQRSSLRYSGYSQVNHDIIEPQTVKEFRNNVADNRCLEETTTEDKLCTIL